MHMVLGLQQRWEIARPTRSEAKVSLSFSLMIRDKNPRFRVDCLHEKNNFSNAGNTFTVKRTSLSSEKLDDLLFLMWKTGTGIAMK